MKHKKRYIEDAPFCWQSKTALREIRDHIGESDLQISVSIAIAIYTILTEIASNCQNESFTEKQSKIACLSGVSTRYVKMVLRELKKMGIIHIEERKSENNLNLSSKYTLLQRGEQTSSQRGELLGDIVSPHIEESNRKINKNKYIEDRFKLFWDVYPRKVGKAKTSQVFCKINPKDTLLEKIIDSVKQQKRSDQWQNEKYIPHPVTWLNQERWNDVLTSPNLYTHAEASKLCVEHGLTISKDFTRVEKNKYTRNHD